MPKSKDPSKVDVETKAAIKACLTLATGKTPEAKAKDFKAKVLASTSINEDSFNTIDLSSTVHGQIAQGEPVEEILQAFF